MRDPLVDDRGESTMFFSVFLSNTEVTGQRPRARGRGGEVRLLGTGRGERGELPMEGRGRRDDRWKKEEGVKKISPCTEGASA